LNIKIRLLGAKWYRLDRAAAILPVTADCL
jgi:hypothetical protein